MGEYFDWWFKGGSWYDLQQQDELASLHASHARATSRLSSKLREEAKRSQDLSTRLSRLEDAVVAMVELEDLRGVMDNFSDAAATRRYARDVLAHIPALGRVPSTSTPEPPPDVPGYWLHPAVRAVDARMRGDQAAEVAAADEARRRDAARTAQFLAAVAILMGSAVAEDDLATLWPTSREVSPYQRALWLAVAAGGLGADARAGLTSALTWVLTRPEDGEPELGDPLRLVQVRMPSASRRSDSLEDVVMSAFLARRDPRDPPTAAEALADLSVRVTSALEAGRALREQGEVPDGVADLLAQVVSAGAPEEEPLVQRIIAIRQALAAIGASTSIAAPALLDDEALDVLELVRGDLAEGADPGARAVAVMALREPIERVAEQLGQLARQPISERTEVRLVGGITVTVAPSGPEETSWRDRIAERVAGGVSPLSGHLGQLIGGGVLALLGLVLGVAANPGWLLLLLPGLGIAGYGFWQVRTDRADLERRVTAAVTDAERTIAERTHVLTGELVAMQQRQGRVPEQIREIETAFADLARV